MARTPSMDVWKILNDLVGDKSERLTPEDPSELCQRISLKATLFPEANLWTFLRLAEAYAIRAYGSRWHIRLQELLDADVAGWTSELIDEYGGHADRRRQRENERRQHRPALRRLREQVYQRDGYACAQCGATENLTLDHIVPLIQGGKTELENLRTLCRHCNSRKGFTEMRQS